MKLKDKVAIVTGAASGMGKAIAELYAKEGAKVIIADLNLEKAEAVSKEINENNGVAQAIEVNIVEQEDIDNMIDTAIESYGTLDILVNNAGVMDGFEPVGDILDERWDLIFDINTKGAMRAMRKAMPIFLEKQEGIIINTTSTGGLNGAHAGAIYSASKHALVGLTKNTGFMYAEKGIVFGETTEVMTEQRMKQFFDVDLKKLYYEDEELQLETMVPKDLGIPKNKT